MRVLVLVIGVVAYAGCGNHNGNNDGGGGSGGGGAGGGGGSGGAGATLKPDIGLDLAHIVGFAITGGPAAAPAWPEAGDGGATTNVATLYAIDDQGNLVVTRVTTPIGDGSFDGGSFDLSATTSSASEVPTAIFDTPRYELFGFTGLHVAIDYGFDGGVQTVDCNVVIMRKSDGALYCQTTPGGNVAMSHVDSDGGDQLFANGLSTTAALTRIDMSTIPPQALSVVDGGITTNVDFNVNADADALASINTNTATGKALRVMKRNGGLQNLVADTSLLQWLAPSTHDFYYINYSTTPQQYTVSLATRQADGSYVASMAGTLPQPQIGQYKLALVTAGQSYGWVSGANVLVEMLGATQGTTHAVPGLSVLVDAHGSGSSIFVQGTDAAGNGGIVRVDVPSFTATTILPPGDFSLTASALSKSGELTFAGLRNSDGKHVVGKVAAGTSTYTISDAAAPVVTQLQRIN